MKVFACLLLLIVAASADASDSPTGDLIAAAGFLAVELERRVWVASTP